MPEGESLLVLMLFLVTALFSRRSLAVHRPPRSYKTAEQLDVLFAPFPPTLLLADSLILKSRAGWRR